MSPVTSDTFQFIQHWPQGTPKDGAAVLDFWRRENAIADEAQAQQRLREVVMHTTDEAGEVAGVCTAVPLTLPRLGQPMYYYRCFIAAKWRRIRLGTSLTTHAFTVLEKYARANNYPCIGVVMELENTGLVETLNMPIWPINPFIYIGKSQRNLELRVQYFDGALLKKPAAP
jgi:hypothetical protein